MKPFTYPIARFLALVLCLGVLQASGPIAVYALVDKVEFQPSADKPESIRISGVFITAVESSDTYSSAQSGYLYFTLPQIDQELARREWADLKSVAGSRQIVGFGSSWGASVRVRKSDEPAKSPDIFPMGNGMIRINADQPRAKALLDYKDR